jgi:hypothetical protein
MDIAEVRTAEGKLYLFVGIDHTRKFGVTQLVDRADQPYAGTTHFVARAPTAPPLPRMGRAAPATYAVAPPSMLSVVPVM